MLVTTKTFDDNVKRLDKELAALRTKVAALEKLTARVVKLEALPSKVTKLEKLPAQVEKLEKLPAQVSKLENSRRLWPLQDYSTNMNSDSTGG